MADDSCTYHSLLAVSGGELKFISYSLGILSNILWYEADVPIWMCSLLGADGLPFAIERCKRPMADRNCLPSVRCSKTHLTG
ncbi:unnamed protein product [Caenorhabditis bovis]|uniref:Uncharacterized protein n=1 Tax=Caenorhabditis bovis TaxID=2654633 RepID=A0A8S1FBI0_9PELO|nr:unnamed protein product [Caenorhabditis bovis]